MTTESLPVTRNLTVVQGETRTLLDFFFSTWELDRALFEARTTGGASILRLDTEADEEAVLTDGAGNRCTFTADNSATVELTPGSYEYECKAWVGGEPISVYRGTLTVVKGAAVDD